MAYNFDEEVAELVKYLQDKYQTDLPADFKPNERYMYKHKDNVVPLFEKFIESAKNAVVTENGLINVQTNIILDAHCEGLMIRESYIDLAKLIILKHEWTPDEDDKKDRWFYNNELFLKRMENDRR